MWYEIVLFPYVGFCLPEIPDIYQSLELSQGRLHRGGGTVPVTYDGGGPVMDFCCTDLTVPILTERAKHATESLVSNDVEWIPASAAPGRAPAWVMNILSVRDCADQEREAAYPDPARAGGLILPRLYIRGDATLGSHIFRLSSRLPVIVVSDAFYECVLHNQLVGPGLIRLDDGDREMPLRPGFPDSRRG
jgi:hypothetical protein